MNKMSLTRVNSTEELSIPQQAPSRSISFGSVYLQYKIHFKIASIVSLVSLMAMMTISLVYTNGIYDHTNSNDCKQIWTKDSNISSDLPCSGKQETLLLNVYNISICLYSDYFSFGLFQQGLYNTTSRKTSKQQSAIIHWIMKFIKGRLSDMVRNKIK